MSPRNPNTHPIPFEISDIAYEPSIHVTSELLEKIENSPKGERYTYGATPLDRFVTAAEQEKVHTTLQSLTYKIEPGVPMQVAAYVHDSFSRRFFGRVDANNENFITRLVTDYETKFSPELIQMIDNGRLGEASPAELLLVRDLLGIRSVELACLTHPYGENIKKYLEVMRTAVEIAIADFDGEYYGKNKKERFRIKDIVGEDEPELLIDGQAPGLFMTRKRDIGKLPDGTKIRERSSFVLRIDEQSQLRAMLGDEAIEELKAIVKLSGDEQENALEKYHAVLKAFLDLDQFSEAIPLSTTIFAFNEETALKVKTEIKRLQLAALRTIYVDPRIKDNLNS